MQVLKPLKTQFQIIEAVENLTDDEKEILAILADEKLAEKLMQRRKQALFEMVYEHTISLGYKKSCHK